MKMLTPWSQHDKRYFLTRYDGMFAVTTVIFQSGYECRYCTDLYCTSKKIYYITLFYYDTIDLYWREKKKREREKNKERMWRRWARQNASSASRDSSGASSPYLAVPTDTRTHEQWWSHHRVHLWALKWGQEIHETAWTCYIIMVGNTLGNMNQQKSCHNVP